MVWKAQPRTISPIEDTAGGKADQSEHIFDNRHQQNQPVQIPMELQFYNQLIPERFHVGPCL
jgi:hypothetical protein